MTNNQRGKALIIGVVLLLLILGGGAYYLRTQKPTQVEATAVSTTTDFPVYPGATFIKKESHDPCPPGGASGFAICDALSYIWQTSDDYDTVSAWYKEDKSNSGWKCSGGAGSYDSARSANGSTTCSKDNVSYSLDLNATAAKTDITLVIPTK